MSHRPSLCLSYIFPDDQYNGFYLPLSLELNRRHPWVDSVSVLVTNRPGCGSYEVDGVQFHCGGFGYGHDRQPENGGIDAVAARNRQLELAEGTHCDWTLICDADEWFEDGVGDFLREIDRRSSCVAGWLGLHHLVSDSQQLHNKSHPTRSVAGIEAAVFDPHIRLIRNNRGIKYALHRSRVFRNGNPNRTSHCGLNVNRDDPDRHGVTEDRLHFHMRYLLGPKCDKNYATAELPADWTRSPIDVSLPAAVMEAWLETRAADAA